jgi:NTE family protein
VAGGISLCLGGGAARGFAHVGAIRALVENDIKINLLVGISMGAICGGIYSVMPDPDFLETRLKQLVEFEAFRSSVVGTWTANQEGDARNIVRRAQKLVSGTNILRRMFTAMGVLTAAEVHGVLYPFIADIQMESTEIRFATSAVNIRTGELRIFQGHDRLRPAVAASASMPLIFPPQKIGADWYVDGGVLDKLGIETVRQLGAPRPIVIDVSDEQLPDTVPKSGFDVILKTEEIASEHRRIIQLDQARLVIRPIKGTYHWADYSAANEFIQMGYDATLAVMDSIRGIANARRSFPFFKSLR